MKVLLVSALAVFLSFAALADDVYVNGYFRNDGTYVQPHYRSAPDGSVGNNWSTQGNVNPYTGQLGTKNPLGGSYSGGSIYSAPSGGCQTLGCGTGTLGGGDPFDLGN